MVSVAKKTYITPEEYLARERLAEFKSEYHDGQIYPMNEPPQGMAGTSRPHNLIAGNLHGEIRNQFKGRPCEAYFSDIRVRVQATGLYTYPDVIVVCGEPRFVDESLDTLLNPNVIVEVLSPSTESWDRGGKFVHYRRLESLRDYVLVSQDKILVEHFTRQGDRWLLTEWSRLEDLLHLESIACEVKLRDIYDKVSFETGEPAPGA
jgi:Uma2 family endonuclease